MRIGRYRGRHLKRAPRGRGAIAAGTATAVWLGSPAAQAATHVVRRGETLSAIAARFRTTVGRLTALNDLENPHFIVAGKRLRVPGGATAPIHVVRSGETLSAVARRYGTRVALLARRNKLSNPNLIVVGQRLRVPGQSAPVLAAPPSASQASIAASLHRQSVSHGVDPSLTKAVAWVESRWRQDVRSRAGALGVMQVMPGTARYVNQRLGGHDLNVRDADDNVHLGVMYLRHLKRALPSEGKALAGYYSGPGNVGRNLQRYQQRYVRLVRRARTRFR